MRKIISAWAEPAAGPGWANTPVWYIYRDDEGLLQQDCLQPAEQSRDIINLYAIDHAVHSRLLGLVEAAVRKLGK
ncbi:hypothetical protein LCGC14_1059420 [marine sediment metagenome]|uniref:Uncharacterized protein n=1 Tax=marine sediment metagenome TaxID=412755 RepID=A0A0F9MLP4_9ZZZZ